MNIDEKKVNWIGLSPDGELQAFLYRPMYDFELKTWVIDEIFNEDFYLTIDLGTCEQRRTTGLYNVEGNNPYIYDDMPAKVWEYVKEQVNGKH